MSTQLLEDLQQLQAKSDSFFKEAQKDKSEHGAGYFFIAKKIDKMIGLITGTREKKKPLMSLTELRQRLVDIASEYGEKAGRSYHVELEIKCDEHGEFYYSSDIRGVIPDKKERYSSPGRIYGAGSFAELVQKFKDILEKDVEKRAEDPKQEKDVVVK